MCFKWFSFSGRGLTDLLQRRIWGDFMRISAFSESKLSFFRFLIIRSESGVLHIGTKWRCFIFAKANASAVFALRATPCQVWKGVCMKHACRRMKRSRDRLYVFFALKSRQKKWGGSFCFRTSPLPERVQISLYANSINCKTAKAWPSHSKLVTIILPCGARLNSGG